MCIHSREPVQEDELLCLPHDRLPLISRLLTAWNSSFLNAQSQQETQILNEDRDSNISDGRIGETKGSHLPEQYSNIKKTSLSVKMEK